ncbi:MAG TPA: alpha/beta fold hydrolase, partial [Patescibacteria group bacterium]|nr:alpha/beta fold hydrolase [Patescibacteria group bacterium]
REHFDGNNFQILNIESKSDKFTTYFIEYKSEGLTISGSMSVPKGKGPFPVVVINHGYHEPAFYDPEGAQLRGEEFFSSNGYVALHPDYRNFGESDKDPNVESNLRIDYAEDVINLIYAVRSAHLEFMNTDNMVMLGHSMGGAIAESIMTTQPHLIKAYSLYSASSADASENFYRWLVIGPEVAKAEAVAHGSPTDNPNFWHDISPINFLANVTEPVIIHHGESDRTVPEIYSENLYKALQKENKTVQFYSYPGEDHKFGKSWALMMQRSLDFFNAQLK